MNPGLWGALTALSWGLADFVARFSGRGVGAQTGLLGMLLAGATALSLWVWLGTVPLRWHAGGLWLLVATGVGTMFSTLLLYVGLARGPVSVVSPIVGGYPALVVLFAVLAGARPSAIHWAAMAVTMLGVLLVARSADTFVGTEGASAREIRGTVFLALGSCLLFALTIFTANLAVPIYGHVQTLWAARLLSLLAVLALFAAQRRMPRAPPRWWPVLGLQGLLDTGGYVTLYRAGYADGAEIAAVTSSAFGAVTTLLAWLVLRERIGLVQWIGIALIFAGVAVLSA